MVFLISYFWVEKVTANVPRLHEVANFVTDNFLLKIKFLAENKREFNTNFAIL